jgi:alpha-L-fucosidase
MNATHQEQWQNLHAAKQEALDWFQAAKYGMFIHWGLFSQLGGVYQGKRMEEGRRPHVSEWIMHAFDIPRVEYADLVRDFNPTNFDAAEWVSLAKAAGMQYLVLTAKHHDGFCLFSSEISDFTAVEASPCQRDFVKELHEECERQGMPFGLYYSHSIDWMDGGDGGRKEYSNGRVSKLHAYNDWDPAPVSFDDYLDRKSLPQIREIVTRYPGLRILWFDIAYHIPDDRSFECYKAVSELSPQTLVSERAGNGYGDYLIPGDNVIPDEDEKLDMAWETVGTTNNSWGYKSYDHDWKPPKEVLLWIVDIISKGGNYMLNIGPKGDGTVPEESAEILREVGAWLTTHRDAIYGTRPWTVSRVGPNPLRMKGTLSRERDGFQLTTTAEDFWFTRKNDNVFAFSMLPTLPDTLTVDSITPVQVQRVTHLASGSEVPFSGTGGKLSLDTSQLQEENLAHVFRIRLDR